MQFSEQDVAEHAENVPLFLAGNLLPEDGQRQTDLGRTRARGGRQASWLDTIHLLVCLADVGESTSPDSKGLKWRL